MAADTQTLRYIIEFDAKYADKLKKSLADVKTQVKDVDGVFKKTSKSTDDFITSIGKLAYRAALTIPLWLAMRKVMMSFLATITMGLESIRELDAGLARAKAVMHGIVDTSEGVEILRGVVRQLGREMGVSAKEVTEAFYRMGTAGLNFEESMEGAKVALKTSIAMMGDVTQTARGLADIYNLMGDSIKGVSTVQEKMEIIGSTMALLWKSNAFELDEFLNSLRNFVPTAKNANMTLDETMGTLAVLHTLMRRSSSAGTEMSRTLLMMTQRLDKVELYMHKVIGTKTTDRFGLLIEILDKLNEEFRTTGDVGGEVAEIFGIKAMKSTATLVGNLDDLKKQLQELKDATPQKRMEILNELFQIQIDTIERQLLILGELRKQSVQAFLVGITGAENYVTALKKINSFIESNLIPSIIFLSVLLRRLFTRGLWGVGGEDPAKLAEQFEKATGKKATVQPNLIQKGILNYIKSFPQAKMLSGIPGVSKFLEGNTNTEEFNKWVKEFKSSNEGKAKEMLKGIGLTEDEISPYLTALEEVNDKYNHFFGSRKEAETKLDNKLKEQFEQQMKNIDAQEMENLTVQNRLSQYDMLAIRGYTQIQIEKQKLQYMVDTNRTLAEQEKQKQKILELTQKELLAYSTVLRESMSGQISKSLIEGKGTIRNVIKDLRETQIKAFSESVSDQILNITGLGAVYGSITQKVRNAFSWGASTTYRAIVSGFRDGNVGSKGGVAGGFSAEGGISNAFGLNNYMGVGGGSYGVKGGLIGPPTKAGARWNTLKGGATLLSAATMGYLTGSQAGGKQAMTAGIMGGAGSSMLAAQAAGINFLGLGGMLGPLGLGLSIGSMLFGLKKRKEPEIISTKTEVSQITSKIDVSNRELAWVNRNLVALRQELSFILPQSAYFSENRDLVNQFSIDSNRGV